MDAGSYYLVNVSGACYAVQPRHAEEVERAMRAYVIQGVDALLVLDGVDGTRHVVAARAVLNAHRSTLATREAHRAHGRALDAEAAREPWMEGTE